MTGKRRADTALHLDTVLSPPIRCQLRGVITEHTERFALRAVLTSARLFGLAAGTHLRQLRNLDDPLAELQARLQEAQLQARLAWDINEILAVRFRKIPEKQRPHYSPAQRFRTLEIKNLLGWPRDSCSASSGDQLIMPSSHRLQTPGSS